MILRGFTFWRIPIIFFLRPVIETLTTERCVVRIPLGHRSRNHLRVMYFGVLCIGADLAGGLIAMRQVQLSKRRVSLVFKDFQARFLRQAKDDVTFTCLQGAAIMDLIRRAEESGQRVEQGVRVVATTAADGAGAPIATFDLTLSMRVKD